MIMCIDSFIPFGNINISQQNCFNTNFLPKQTKLNNKLIIQKQQKIMKILKRLSLMSTITRVNDPKPHSPWLQHKIKITYKNPMLSPEQQLIKYGYTSKPKPTPFGIILCFIFAFCGLSAHLYLVSLYKNEQFVRNRYRIEQQEHSSLILRLRRFFMSFAVFVQKQLFFSEIIFTNQTKKLLTISEAILRTEQYRNYMQKRDRKFEFMDIGVMEKFPFPDIKQND